MASGNNWHGLVGNLRKKGRFNRDKELVLFNPLNYRLSASFQTSHGSGPCCYHILLTTNVSGKKMQGYRNKKNILTWPNIWATPFQKFHRKGQMWWNTECKSCWPKQCPVEISISVRSLKHGFRSRSLDTFSIRCPVTWVSYTWRSLGTFNSFSSWSRFRRWDK